MGILRSETIFPPYPLEQRTIRRRESADSCQPISIGGTQSVVKY